MPTRRMLLAIAAALEVGSRHPIAQALLTAAYQLHLPATQNLQHYPAGGVEAIVDGVLYRIGHADFAMDAAHDDTSSSAQSLNIDLIAHRASSAVVLSCQSLTKVSEDTVPNWQALACFYFNDKVRDSAKATLDSLKQLGIESVMLTGDPSPQVFSYSGHLRDERRL